MGGAGWRTTNGFMALSWYQRSRSNPYAYHTTSGQYARAPLWPLPLPASLPRWEVVLVSAPSASAGAAGAVGAVFVSFAGPRPLLRPPTGPATRPLPRHPPSRFLQVQKPGFISGLAPIRDTSTFTTVTVLKGLSYKAKTLASPAPAKSMLEQLVN